MLTYFTLVVLGVVITAVFFKSDIGKTMMAETRAKLQRDRPEFVTSQLNRSMDAAKNLALTLGSLTVLIPALLLLVMILDAIKDDDFPDSNKPVEG